MQSCSTEDIEVSTASTVVGQLKDDLKLDQFVIKNFAENIVNNWETINTIEKNGVTVYEVQISEIKQTTIESNLFQEQLKYGLIDIKKGGEIRSYKNIVNREIDSNTTFAELTYEINSDDNGLDHRGKKFEKAKNNINCI